MLERVRSSRGAVSLLAVAVLGSLSAFGLVGSGFSGAVVDSLPGSAWLSSNGQGDVVLAGAGNGSGVARVKVPGSEGKSMSVVHRGGFACVRAETPDGEATVNCIDDATFGDAGSLKVSQNQEVIRTGSRAYLIHEAKGLVRSLDPTTLKPEGDPLEFEPPIGVTANDGGQLMVLELEGSTATIVDGGSATEAVAIGAKKGNLFGSLVDGQFAVVAPADRKLTLFDGDTVDRRVSLPGKLEALLVPTEVDGRDLPMLSRKDGQAEVVAFDTAANEGRRVKVATALPPASEVYATSQGIFVPDPQAGSVVRINTRSGATETIDLGVGKGSENFEAFVKDDRVWINNPNGSKAVVIDGDGNVTEVNKYDPEIGEVDPGWDEEPAPPTPETPTAPSAPTPAPPSNSGTPAPQAPTNIGGGAGGSPAGQVTTPTARTGTAPVLSPLDAAGGSRSVTLSWGVSGMVDSYRLTCTPSCSRPSIAPGAMQVMVEGLTNGERYAFELTATNEFGSDSASAEARPTGDVPDQVTGVDAVAQRGSTPGVGGPVDVSWSPERSSGLEITGYVVTAANGAVEIPFDAAGSATSLSVPGDGLDGGAIDDDETGDWTFTVLAVSERSGSQLAGEPSGSSSAIDLFTVVPAPQPTAVSQDGNIRLTWNSVSSGRPISYLVNGESVGADLQADRPGANGSPQSFTVTARDSAAGEGMSPSVGATPHGPPSAQLTVTSPAYNTIRVQYSIDWNGAEPGSNNRCTVTGATCNAGGGTAQYSSAAGNQTATITLTNAFGESRSFSGNVTVSNPPPAVARGRACATAGVCVVNYVNWFSDSGKDSFSPGGRYNSGTEFDISCQATGYQQRLFYRLSNGRWVIAREFPVINGLAVGGC